MRSRKKPRIGDKLSRPDGRIAQYVRERDDENKQVEYFRVMDSLAQMLKNKTISREMYDAGRIFESDFHRAFGSSCVSLWPSETSGVDGSLPGESAVVLNATAAQFVRKAIDAAGGYESPGASARWYVVGLGMSITEWALHEGWRGSSMNVHAAKGVLITALGVLAKAYRLVERPGKIRVAHFSRE